MSMQTKTTLAQHLPNDMEEKIMEFHCFVMAARQRCNYPLSQIFNMDETPMRFELPSTCSLEFSGNRIVPVKSCRTEKRSFLVTLGVAVMARHYHQQSRSKVYEPLVIWLFLVPFKCHSTRRDGWMNKV